MILNKEQRKAFEEAARPMIKFLNKNCHPHVVVDIDRRRAGLSEGICSFVTDDYMENCESEEEDVGREFCTTCNMETIKSKSNPYGTCLCS